MNQNNLDTIKHFVQYVKKELNIQSLPSIKLIADKDFVSTYRSYGEYNPNQNYVKVFYLGRNLADVCRSLAHEIIHHRQMELGMLDHNSGDTGSEIENEANALAGIIMRDYGKLNLSVYDLDNQLSELKVSIYPKGQGVDIDDPTGELEKATILTLPMANLVTNEPASKMKQPDSKITLKNLMKAIRDGEKIPPIVVRKLGDKYQILDGHHRYFAMKALGLKNAKVVIVPNEDIDVLTTDYKD